MKKRASLAEANLGFLTDADDASVPAPARPVRLHPTRDMTALRDGHIVHLPLHLIDPNPDQPRHRVQEAKIEELARSIREKGILQPIVVRAAEATGRFELLAGERRYRACRLAGLDSVPALVRDLRDRLEIALIENLQREDLHPVDAAEACAELVRRNGYTHETVAMLLGRKRTTMTEILSIGSMPQGIRSRCRSLDLAQRTLVEIAKLAGETQMNAYLDAIEKRGLTGDEVRAKRRGRVRSRADLVAQVRRTTRALVRRLEILEPAPEDAAILRADLLALGAAVCRTLASMPNSDGNFTEHMLRDTERHFRKLAKGGEAA